MTGYSDTNIPDSPACLTKSRRPRAGLLRGEFRREIRIEAVYICRYILVTPHHEADQFQNGNAAASVGLGGAAIGALNDASATY